MNTFWLIPAAITAGLLVLAVFALVKILRADGLGIVEEDSELGTKGLQKHGLRPSTKCKNR